MNPAFQAKLARLKVLLKDHSLNLESALDRFVLELRDPTITELLDRAAVPKTFDRALYDAVLARDLPTGDAPTFAEFLKLDAILPVPGVAGRYWLSSDERQRALNRWRTNPRGFARLNAAIAEFLAAEGPLTRLPYLLRSDVDAAMTVFTDAFEEAETRFDLAQCFGLLNAVGDPDISRSPELQEAWEERQRRFRARSLFANAYYRTGTFFRRRAVYAAFECYLKDGKRWIWHLHARGGMGKTTLLRWLLSRDLVPRGVPCAYADFDDLKISAVRRWPWLLLAPLFEQLDLQLPQSFLAGALDEIQPYTHLLSPLAPDGGSMPPDDQGERLVNKAGLALKEANLPCVLLALDTLELVTLFPEEFAKLFHYIIALQGRVPALRVVLAGRDPVDKKVPQLAPVLAQYSISYPLPGFSDLEADAYLRTRAIDSTDVRAAILDKVHEPMAGESRSGCNPFKLSLLADIVLGKESMTAQEIRALPSADYQYLIERIIKRISDQALRWVVRYGVIPRRLTLDYVEKVLLDPLQRVLRGEALDLDRPQDVSYLPENARQIAEQDIWMAEPGVTVEARRLWTQLLRYETERGWLTHAGGSDPDKETLQFHGEVVHPMRDLLSFQNIFVPLQSASAQYCEARAAAALEGFRGKVDTSPSADVDYTRAEAWTQWMCEATFHRFQALDPDAPAFWQAQCRHPTIARYPELRLRLAGEILGAEYCKEQRTPRMRRNRPIVSVELLGLAHFMTARVLLEMIRRASRESSVGLRGDLEVHNRHAQQIFAAAADTFRGQKDALALLDANVMQLEQRHSEALAILEGLAARDTPMQLEVLSSLAQAYAAVGNSKRASEAYRDASILARYHHVPPEEQARLLHELSSSEARVGSLNEARHVLVDAIEVTRRADGTPTVAHLLALARFDLETGDVASAEALLKSAARLTARLPQVGSGIEYDYAFYGSIRRVTLLCSSADYELLLEAREHAATTDARIDLAIAAASIAADTLRFSDAVRLLARQMRHSERLADSHLLSALATSLLQTYNKMGAYRQVLTLGSSLGSVSSLLANPEIPLAEEFVIAAAHCGNVSLAREHLGLLLSQNAQTEPWADMARYRYARALTLGIALDLIPRDPDVLDNLLNTLRPLYSPLRLQALQPLDHCVTPIAVSSEWFDKLLTLLEDTIRAPHSGHADREHYEQAFGNAFVIMMLRLGETARAFGQHDYAVKLMQELEDHLSPGKAPLRTLRILQARARLGHFDASIVEPILKGVVPKSLLGGALFLHAAEIILAVAGDLEVAEALLDGARQAVEAESLHSRWHAMLARLDGTLAVQKSRTADAERFAILAKSLSEELGCVAPVQRSSTPLAGPERESQRESTPVRSAAQNASLSRVVAIPRGAEGVVGLSSAQRDFWQSLAPRAGRKVSEALAELFTDSWQSVAEQLGSLLYSPQISQIVLQAPRAPALGLLIPQTHFDALPWEVSRQPGELEWGVYRGIRVCSRLRYGEPDLPHETVRFLQQRLRDAGFGELRVDGILGPLTVAVVKQFQKERSLAQTGWVDAELLSAIRNLPRSRGRPSRVLIVESSVALSDREHTSYLSRGGSNLARRYEPYADVEVIDASFERLRDVITSFQPALIHLVASIRETSGIVFLDFARRRSSSEGRPITTVSLDGVVKRIYAVSARPFLILDIVRPSSTFEAALALGLRNSFASDLLHLGAFSGVLATGLEQPWMLGGLAGWIETCLRRHSSTGELARCIRELFASEPARRDSSSVQDRAIAYLGTALFAQDTDLPCLPS